MAYKQSTHYIHRIEENFSRSGGKFCGFEPFPSLRPRISMFGHTQRPTRRSLHTHRTDAKKPPVADRVALAKMGTTL